MLKRFLCLLLLLALLPCAGTAETVRGYEKGEEYQYVVFGRYPYDEDGTVKPLLWRVLIVRDGVAFMITDAIIDFIQYNLVKDTDKNDPLDYPDSLIAQYCLGEGLRTMFTAEEQTALTDMGGGRGVLSLATTEELQNPETGFSRAKYTVDKRRHAKGTPYAYAKGLKKIVAQGYSWYWTADWRRLGFRWIVGDNGHISCVGSDRFGGLRPVIYADLSKVQNASGKGTADDPYVWELTQ